MKKTLLVLGILMSFVVLNSEACETPPTITGNPIIELNTSGNNYTLNMSSTYLNSLGGYQETQWSFEGIGIIGYSTVLNPTSDSPTTTINITTTSSAWSNLPEGKYDLIARNRFGTNPCYGCLSNTTHVLEDVDFRRPRPDLIITAEYFDENSNSLAENTFVTTDLIVSNIGNASSPPVTVTITLNWKNSSGNESNNSITFSGQTIQPAGTFTIPDVSILTPLVNGTGTSESWTLTCTVDSEKVVNERSDDNNNKSYSKKITRPSSRALTSEDSYSDILIITNMSGDLIWKKGQEPIDFSKLKGAYIFKFKENGVIHTQKIVKQ